MRYWQDITLEAWKWLFTELGILSYSSNGRCVSKSKSTWIARSSSLDWSLVCWLFSLSPSRQLNPKTSSQTRCTLTGSQLPLFLILTNDPHLTWVAAELTKLCKRWKCWINVMQVMQVRQVILVMQISLAHLWVDFRVFLTKEQVFLVFKH